MKCSFCKTGILTPYFTLRKNSLETIRCSNCKTVIVNHTPVNEENISQYYTMDAFKGKRELQNTDKYVSYYKNCYVGYNVNDYTILQFKKILSEIKDLLNKKASLRLLDIGCATGVFLTLASNAGYRGLGVELSQELSQYARDSFQLEIYNDLIDAKFLSKSFDVITLLDVIEHLPYSMFDTVMIEVLRILKPEGLLVIRTPSEDALLRTVAKVLFFGSLKRIEAPMHLFYSFEHILNFSLLSLRHGIERFGFKLIRQRREEENPKRLNIGWLDEFLLRCIYLFSAIFQRQHKMVQFYSKI